MQSYQTHAGGFAYAYQNHNMNIINLMVNLLWGQPKQGTPTDKLVVILSSLGLTIFLLRGNK